MKLISNYFDMGLFREGLRQNKVIGIIGLAISIGFSVLTPVGAALMVAYFSFMNHFDMMLYGDVDEIPDYASRLNDFLDDIHLSCEGMFDTSYMTIVFLILVSIATFRLFNFLTKRNASDYFHSFPHKRSCIFTSYILSIVFMSFVQSLAFFVTTSVTYGILYYFFGFTLYKSFIYAIEIFIVCILVTVTVATACAMTGNLFSSIVVSAVLLAVPRLFITILSAEITLGTDHLVFNRLSEFSNINTNLLTALTLRSSGGMMISLDQFLDTPGLYAIIYTLGLAFVTYIIGLIFFKKKHSEAAGKPSNTPFLQLIFRTIPAMPLTIIPIAMLIYPGVDIVDFFANLADNPFTLFVIVAIELACMSIMMLYEIISTKSFNKSYKGILTMPLFLLIQMIIVAYFSIVSYREIHFAPDTDKINFIVPIELDDDGWTSDFSFNHSLHSIYNYKITDEEAIGIVSEYLKEAVEEVDGNENNDDYGSDYYNSNSVTVAINTGLSTRYRTIELNEVDYIRLKNCFLEDNNFRKLYHKTIEEEDDFL